MSWDVTFRKKLDEDEPQPLGSLEEVRGRIEHAFPEARWSEDDYCVIELEQGTLSLMLRLAEREEALSRQLLEEMEKGAQDESKPADQRALLQRALDQLRSKPPTPRLPPGTVLNVTGVFRNAGAPIPVALRVSRALDCVAIDDFSERPVVENTRPRGFVLARWLDSAVARLRGIH